MPLLGASMLDLLPRSPGPYGQYQYHYLYGLLFESSRTVEEVH